MWGAPKSLPSLIVGLLLLAMGLIPILNMMGIIGFALPEILSGLVSKIIFWVVAVAGLYLIIDAFMEFDEPIGKVALLVGILVLVIGLIPLLQQFGIIGFGLPAMSAIIYNIIFAVEGILLIISAWNF